MSNSQALPHNVSASGNQTTSKSLVLSSRHQPQSSTLSLALSLPPMWFIFLLFSPDRSIRRIIGRRPKFTEWDDGLLKSYLDPSGQRSKVSSQHTHDQICLAWPGSRVPLEASGKEMPIGSIMPTDWPYWRTRCLTDLAPKGFDMSSVRFDLGSDLSVVDPDEEARIKGARKDLLAAFRQVGLVPL
jgi:hypothetical protein